MIILPQYASFCVTPLVPKYHFLEVQHSRITSRLRCMLTSKMDVGRRSVFSGLFSTFNDQRYGALPLRAQILKMVRLSEVYRFTEDQWKRR
jgi:hypothetical protein